MYNENIIGKSLGILYFIFKPSLCVSWRLNLRKFKSSLAFNLTIYKFALREHFNLFS
jgi:hypothetical protein